MGDEHIESQRIGRALASQSHELKNVLASVGEAAGLMEDLFDMARDQGFSLPETMAPAFERSLKSMSAQVSRGHRLCTDLNTLAHMTDWRKEGQTPKIDLGQTAALAVRFMERPARQHQVTLEAPEPCGVTVAADPFAVVTALMAILECSWQGMAADSSLRLITFPGTSTLEMEPAPSAEALTPEARELTTAAGLHLAQADGRLRVTLKEGAK